MCGIVGFLQPGGISSEEAEGVVELMSRQLVHRGPDGHGVWVDEQDCIAIGHRRLSVVDLSSAGHQPMLSACARWMISFNGEIYNHNEIRVQLESQGKAPQWRGHSDTETVLAAVTAWGIEAAIKAMVGMFAFAFWDRSKKVLHLVRDRMGEKPLYYGWQGNTFLFGSELKALARHPQFVGDIDPMAIGRFFSHNYIPAPLSIYRGVYKLPPASWLQISKNDAYSRVLPEPQTYWSLSSIVTSDGNQYKTIDAAADELEDLLQLVLKGQMHADVPLGAFLSGGIDSSLIVALMQSKVNYPVKSFAIGMPDVGLDESEYAAAVAVHLGTDHIGHTISSSEALAIVPKLPEIWDEPFADSSQIPTLLVSNLARQHVSVVLSGDGADELFLGYKYYKEMQNIWRGRFLSSLPIESGAALLRRLGLPGSSRITPRFAASLATLLAARSKEELVSQYLNRYRNEPIPMKNIFVENFVGNDDICHGIAESLDPALLTALRDEKEYLPDNIMVKVDRASMSASLETRAPFLDHRVVEFAWRLPLKYKLNGQGSKRILHRLLHRHVPQALVERPKQGFSIPVAKWLRGDLREWGDSLLNSSDLEDCGLKSKQVRKYWNDHQKGIDHSGRLWAILMLRAFFEYKIK